ncbi:MAG: agmatine deiminase family protein [Verrucomicrobiota bacterium]
MKRRSLIRGLGLAALGAGVSKSIAQSDAMLMPGEGETHACTWMGFGVDPRIWGRQLLPGVEQAIADIANAISEFEPVRMLVEPASAREASRLLSEKVEQIPLRLDDIWLRDTGPVFSRRGNELVAIDFNFNGWGGKQQHRHDSKVAARVAELAGVERLVSRLCLEGGGLEVDGEGAAVLTESCILISNRNPGVSRNEAEEELSRLLGIEHFVWLPGVAGTDITDGHVDFYARFGDRGDFLVGLEQDATLPDFKLTRRHLSLINEIGPIQSRARAVNLLKSPLAVRPGFDSPDFAAGYVGFYVCNGAVIAPEFGDEKADEEAHEMIAATHPDRELVALNIDALAAGGGSIHCVTQQQPSV